MQLYCDIELECIPVFADIDPLTFNIDPHSIEKNISRQKPMAVDIFGQSCDIDSILITKKYKLKVITDCAQLQQL